MISTRDFLLLFLVAIVSSSIAIFLRGARGTHENVQVTSLVQGDELQFDSIQSISIRRNGKAVLFERKDRKWWQVEPFEMRMDFLSMQNVITSVQSVQEIGNVSTKTDLDTVGLGESANTISLADDTNVLEIKLGRKTLGGRAYAQMNDASPVLIDQSLHRIAIDMDYKLWRDTRLFPDFAIDGVRIDRVINGDRLLLDRTGGRWEMLQPVSTRVDQNILLEWVGRIAASHVGSFVQDEPNDLALFGLHSPIATFGVEDGKGTTHTLLVGGRVSAGSEDRYVMLEGIPVVFRVQWEPLSQLFPASEIFVDATGSAVSRFDVKRVLIRTGSEELVFERNLESWLKSDGVPLDTEKVNALMTWLLETKPPEVSIGEYPRANELALITLIGYDQLPLDTVRIAQAENGLVILENGDNVLRWHPAESLEALRPFID